MPSPTMDEAPSGKPAGTAASGPVHRGNRRTDNEAKTTGRRPTRQYPRSSRGRRCSAGHHRRLLRQPLLQRADILKQPRAGKAQKIEAEGGILHIQFLDLAVADAENETRLDAFQR